MDEADEGSTRARTPALIDERDAGLAERGERRVDVRRLERQMMKPRAPRRDELRDRALVLARRPRRAGIDAARLARIEVLEELELAIARGDEGHTQAPDQLRWPRVVDGAVLVGREALHGEGQLDVGLLALDLTPEASAPGFDGRGVVPAGDAEMVHAFHQWRAGRLEIERRHEPGRDARRAGRIERDATAIAQARDGTIAQRRDARAPGGLGRRAQIVRGERDVVNARPVLAIDIRMAGRAQGDPHASHAEDGHRAGPRIEIRPPQSALALEDAGEGISVADGEGDVGDSLA